jgi:hypothetical protein
MANVNPDELISKLLSGDSLSRRKRAFLKQYILQSRRSCDDRELQALDLLGVDSSDALQCPQLRPR